MTSVLAPRYWGAHLLMLLAVAASLLLGQWQLGVWQAGRDAEARDVAHLPARSLEGVMGPDAPFPGTALGRAVTFRGEWMPVTLFVSGRLDHGRTGYWVVSPVRVASSGSAMPVVRGWSPVPQAPARHGPARITGWLQAGEGSGQQDRNPSDDVLPELRVASLVEKIDADLYGAYVVSQRPTDGLAEVTPDDVPSVSSFTALRNLLYGLQWWFFAGFAVVIWWRWCRDQVEHVGEPSAEVAG